MAVVSFFFSAAPSAQNSPELHFRFIIFSIQPSLLESLAIYTTIGIDECSLGLDDTSITAKSYILQKICFQRLCSKFLGF